MNLLTELFFRLVLSTDVLLQLYVLIWTNLTAKIIKKLKRLLVSHGCLCLVS